MAQIKTLLRNAGHTRYPVQPSDRWFGGTKSTERERKNIAYAWRRHRASWRTRPDRFTDMPFWFRVTGSVYRDARIGRDRDGKGKANRTLGNGRVIGFVTAADRKRAIPFLRELGYTRFTEFHDVRARFALQIGRDAAQDTQPLPQPLKPGVLFSNRAR